jgi:hypothetical protein
LPQPIDPSSALVGAVMSQLGDKHFRASLRHMHQQGYPLLKIVEALGLDDDVSPALRTALENLGPDDIAEIRRRTLEMLDRTEAARPRT